MNLRDSRNVSLVLLERVQALPGRRHKHGRRYEDHEGMWKYRPEDRARKKRQRLARKQRYE